MFVTVRRIALLVCLFSCGGAATCAGLAQAGTLTWSAATPVAASDGGIVAAACPTFSDCTVVSANGGSETFNPAAPASATSGQATGQGAQPDTSLSCPSTTECLLGDEQSRVWMFDPLSTGTAWNTAFAGEGATVVGCPNTMQCTVGGLTSGGGVSANSEETIDPVSVTGLATQIPIAMAGVAISCPSVTQCTEVGGINEETFDPQDPDSGNVATATAVDGVGNLTAVSCPSITQCTAVDDQGHAVTFDPQLATAPVDVVIDAGHALVGVSCTTNAECVAADASGQVVQGDPQTAWNAPLQIAARPLTAVACTSAFACVAADNGGYVYVSTGQVSGASAATAAAVTSSTSGVAKAKPAGATTAIVAGHPSIGSIASASTGLRVTLACAGTANARCTFYLSLAAGLKRGKAATKTVTISSGTHTVSLLIRTSVRGMLKKYGRLYGVLSTYQKLGGQWRSMGDRDVTMFW